MQKKEPWYKTQAAKDSFSLVASALSNIAIIGAKAVGGWPAFMTSSALITTGQIFHSRKQVDDAEKNLLNFYGDKVGTMLHKDPKSLTLADLYKAAAPVEKGGLGIATLNKQVAKFEDFRRIKTEGRLASMALITLAVVAVAAVPATALTAMGVSSFALFSVMTAAATGISKTVEGITDAILRKTDEGRVTQQVYGIAQQVKQTGTNPIAVLDVFVKARPELQKTISERYGNYSEMPAFQKMQIVRDSEPALHISALTNEINKGTIKPNFLGFVAYNQDFAELPDSQRYAALSKMPAPATTEASPAQQPSNYVEKLAAEKSDPSAARTLH